MKEQWGNVAKTFIKRIHGGEVPDKAKSDSTEAKIEATTNEEILLAEILDEEMDAVMDEAVRKWY